MSTTAFPGRLIKINEGDAFIVSAVQDALARRGYGPFTARGVFDARMKSVVRQFQSQNLDSAGAPLNMDGEVGILTWGALFPARAPIPRSSPSELMRECLNVGMQQIGVMEDPPGSNRGPIVDRYLRAVGINPEVGPPETRPWCMAFIYWSFNAAAGNLGAINPLPRTAGCLDHWNKAAKVGRAIRVPAPEAYSDPSLLTPGMVFVMDFGRGFGHTGLVEAVLPGGRLVTIEGNTNNDGSRTGVGVFRLFRKLSEARLKGFVSYADA